MQWNKLSSRSVFHSVVQQGQGVKQARTKGPNENMQS